MTSSAPAASSQPRRSLPLWVLPLGGLGLVALVVLFAAHRSTNEYTERIHADFAVLEGALERYRADHSTLPEEADLEELLVPKYLSAVPLDPWGRHYRFASNGEQKVFLVTYGQSDDRGGNGAEQDHSNWDGHPRPPAP